jgi:periplasmic copper chaperone A
MTRLRFFLAALLVVSAGHAAVAADVTVGSLKITAPWSRATPKGAEVGGGYMTIVNSGTVADRLIGGSSSVADKFEIHEMSMDGGVMKMRPLANGIEIKPGETVALKPGGLHLMFVGLKAPLTQGDTVKVTLQFEKAGEVDVDYPVAAIGAAGPGETQMKHDMHGNMPGMSPGMGGMKH